MTDIFGQALKGYLNGDLPKHVIQGKDGYLDVLNTEIYFSDYSDWKDHEKAILRYVQGRVLDIGGGAGRHSLFFQKRGHEVHAIDISPSAIALMKIRGVKNVRLMDLRAVDFPEGHFDSVLIMAGDLGLAGSIKDSKKLLRNLFKITSPQGRIIATIKNPYDGKQSAEMAKVKARIAYKGGTGDWFSILMISPQRLKTLARGTGWVVSQIVEGDNGFYGALLEKRSKGIM